jgi:hypothetical protein
MHEVPSWENIARSGSDGLHRMRRRRICKQFRMCMCVWVTDSALLRINPSPVTCETWGDSGGHTPILGGS